MHNVRIVILAGGQGTRFWPISRMKRPKQFLSLNPSGESLISVTAKRVEPLSGKDNIWVVTNVLHKELTAKHTPNAKVILEPYARNTAPSIGLACVHLLRESSDAVMVVLPADHSVRDEDVLLETLKEGIELASKQATLVTIGIPPTFAHTGYGYIKRGKKLKGHAYTVDRFFEKPNLERAKEYCKKGDYYWNSGMFVWRADTLLDAIKDHIPDLYAGLMNIKQTLGTPAEAETVRKVFETCEALSIDFGVLEHAKNCSVIAASPFGWNDVGSWDAWAEHFETDKDGNLLHGDALVIEAKNCVVNSENRLIALLGVKDLVVIDGGDALLVCPRDRVQDVRQIVEELKRKGRNDLV